MLIRSKDTMLYKVNVNVYELFTYKAKVNDQHTNILSNFSTYRIRIDVGDPFTSTIPASHQIFI